MAIINTRTDGVGTLIETLLNKERLAQSQEQLKLQKDAFKLEQEQHAFKMDQARGQQEGISALIGLLPEPQQAIAAGLSPAGRAAFVPGALDVTNQQADIRAKEAQVDHWKALEEIEQQRIDLQARRDEVSEEQGARALDLEELGIQSRERMTKLQLAQEEIQGAFRIAGSLGMPPTQFFLSAYGTDDPEQIRQELLSDAQVGGAEGQKRRLTRLLTGMQIAPNVQNSINEALFTEDIAPQDFLREIFARDDVEDTAKENIFYALYATYGPRGIQIPEGIEDPGLLRRIFNFLGGFNVGGNPYVGG